MQIILQKTVSNIGLVGDVVDVKPGYFRNFLSPRKLAVLASTGSVRQIEHQKKVIEAQKVKERSLAQSIQTRIEASPITLTHSAGDGDKLFGSITSQEIVNALREGGFEVDKRQVQLEAPIKTLGEHDVKVKLHPDVVATVKVTIARKEGEKKEVAEKTKVKATAKKETEATPESTPEA